MQTKPSRINCQLAAFALLGVLLSGCETTNPDSTSSSTLPSPAGGRPVKYKATDGRIISIGASSAGGGGWNFKEPHLEKCWLADGFDFKGYDTLYLAPTLSTAKFHDDEAALHQLAMENLVIELNRSLAAAKIFASVVTKESDIKSGARVLKLTNTITDYAKGGGAARYFVGLYGGGQPVLRVQGSLTGGDKALFTYTVRRSGTSANARMGGAFMKDEDIQLEDIRSMVLDLTDFMAAIAGKYPPAN